MENSMPPKREVFLWQEGGENMSEKYIPIDAYHFVSPDINGEPQSSDPYLDYQQEWSPKISKEQIVFMPNSHPSVLGEGQKSPDEALQESLRSMSDKDREAYEQRLREFFDKYQGPGGP